MRILVTGSGGFLGQRLTAVLREEGHEPVATTRNQAFALDSGMHFLADALNVNQYERIISDYEVDVVINCLAAGVDPTQRDRNTLIEANSAFPARLAAAAKSSGARHFIHIGSSAEYAETHKSRGIVETDALMSQKLYGATKAAGSLILEAGVKELGISYAILRLFNIFGPGEREYRLFPSLVHRLHHQQKVPLSVANQIRDFLYVDDACYAISRMLNALVTKSNNCGIYNLASGRGVSVRDFALSIAAEMGSNPNLLCFGELPTRPDDLPYVVADTTKIERVIGKIESTSIKNAVATMLAIEKKCEAL